MRNAQASVASFYFDCPHCGGEIAESSNGSIMWDLPDLPDDGLIECYECGVVSKIPAKILRIASEGA